MKVKIKTLAWKQHSHSAWLAIMTCRTVARKFSTGALRFCGGGFVFVRGGLTFKN